MADKKVLDIVDIEVEEKAEQKEVAKQDPEVKQYSMQANELGKIKSVHFGFQNNLFGLFMVLGNDRYSVPSQYSYNPSYNGPEGTSKYMENMVKATETLLRTAKVSSVEFLLNMAVMVSFKEDQITGFRILTEVL